MKLAILFVIIIISQGCKTMSIENLVDRLKDEDNRLVKKKSVTRVIGKKELTGFSNQLYLLSNSEWENNLNVAFLEGTKKDTTYEIAIVFKDNRVSKIQSIPKSYTERGNKRTANYFIGNLYDKFDKTNHKYYLVSEFYVPYRTDTLRMKFQKKFAKMIRSDSVVIQ